MAGTRFVVSVVPTTGSTNDDLLARAADGAPDGAVLVADHQSAGHGRRDRRWEAPPGSSLLVSVLTRPALDPADLHLVTAAVGVAAAGAVDEVAGVPARLKWPNDLVVATAAGERKLGGILAEAVWSGEHLVAVVVGLGLNVAWPDRLPEELADLAVALNHLTDRPVDRRDLLEALLRRLEPRLADLTSGELLDAWRARSATLGRDVRVELASGEVVTGTAVDLTASGHLLVRTEGGTEEVLAGDVFHLRPV